MLSKPKRKRFPELRRREDEGTLTPEEQEELSLLIQEIEDAEAAYLRPATERLRRECETIELQNEVLRAFVSRGEALVAQLESVLSRLEEEREALEEERARALGQRTSAETTVRS